MARKAMWVLGALSVLLLAGVLLYASLSSFFELMTGTGLFDVGFSNVPVFYSVSLLIAIGELSGAMVLLRNEVRRRDSPAQSRFKKAWVCFLIALLWAAGSNLGTYFESASIGIVGNVISAVCLVIGGWFWITSLPAMPNDLAPNAPVSARGVWWCMVLVIAATQFNLGQPQQRDEVGLLLIPFPLIMLAICAWWYRQSKLLCRRHPFLQFLGHLLLGFGVFFTSGIAGEQLTHNYSDEGVVPLLICVLGVAAIPAAYFLVFQQGSAMATQKEDGATKPWWPLRRETRAFAEPHACNLCGGERNCHKCRSCGIWVCAICLAKAKFAYAKVPNSDVSKLLGPHRCPSCDAYVISDHSSVATCSRCGLVNEVSSFTRSRNCLRCGCALSL
jgi:hypothetical protein